MMTISPSLISPDLSLADIPLEETLSLGVMASGSGSNFAVLAAAIARFSSIIVNLNPEKNSIGQ